MDNFLCAGIDLHPDLLPEFTKKEGLDSFCKNLLHATKKITSSIKLQSSFFEALGWRGIQLLEEVCQEAKKLNFFVILDAKRGDISTTMSAYGKSAFEVLGADALTIQPYMGTDVLDPLKNYLQQKKIAYVLLHTSNPSAAVLQKPIYLNVKNIFDTWFSSHKISPGYVIGWSGGQEYSEEFLNSKSTTSYLIPGIGAQGGDAQDPKLKKFLANNPLSLVNVSRGLWPKNTQLDQKSWFKEYENLLKSYGEKLSKN